MDHASPEDMRKETEPTNDVNRHRSGGLPWTLPSCFSEDLWQGDSKTVAATLNLQLSSASRGEQQQTAKVDQCRAQDAAQRGVEQNERRTLLQPMMLNSSALSTAGYDMLADAIACSAEFERSLRVHSVCYQLPTFRRSDPLSLMDKNHTLNRARVPTAPWDGATGQPLISGRDDHSIENTMYGTVDDVQQQVYSLPNRTHNFYSVCRPRTGVVESSHLRGFEWKLPQHEAQLRQRQKTGLTVSRDSHSGQPCVSTPHIIRGPEISADIVTKKNFLQDSASSPVPLSKRRKLSGQLAQASKADGPFRPTDFPKVNRETLEQKEHKPRNSRKRALTDYGTSSTTIIAEKWRVVLEDKKKSTSSIEAGSFQKQRENNNLRMMMLTKYNRASAQKEATAFEEIVVPANKNLLDVMTGAVIPCPNLPEGYKAEVRFRETGNGRGRHYFLYLSPDGERLRSKIDVEEDFAKREDRAPTQ